MKRKSGCLSLVAVLLLSLLVLASCAMFQKVKPWADRSPQEKALAFNDAYIAIYDDTYNMAADPKSTPAQLQTAAAKKKVLTEIWPLLLAYNRVVKAGGVPTKAEETVILDLFNKLGKKIT